MRLSQRQGDLLFAAVHEYIRTGEPVASEDLRGHYRLPYSPATIRAELLTLSEGGFLSQPHTSAGRIPSDDGYRWYAERVRNSGELERKEARLVQDLASHIPEPAEFFKSLSETFAKIAETLVVAGDAKETPEPFYKSGFREILASPEFTDADLRDSLGELVDSIDREMRELVGEADFRRPHVFIGKENPIKREVIGCSMIVKTVTDGKKLSGVIAIIGPKRMRYDKGFSLLREIEKFLDE